VKRLASLSLAMVMAIGIGGIALADGTAKSITGNLEDGYCYGTMGAKGAGHKACAIKCAKAGIPVALVEQGTEKIFVLLPNKDETPLPDTILNGMENQVTVTGKEYSKGGVNFLVVESVK
jgi:hypothetical protein